MAKKNTEDTTPGPLPGFGRVVNPGRTKAKAEPAEKPAPKKAKASVETEPTAVETEPPSVETEPTAVETGPTAVETGPVKKTRKPRVPRDIRDGVETIHPEAMAPIQTAVGRLKAKLEARDLKYSELEQKVAAMKIDHEQTLSTAKARGYDEGYKAGIRDSAAHVKELLG